MTELQRVKAALEEYRTLPKDVGIGTNGPADKVTWLIRRLHQIEAHSAKLVAEVRMLREYRAGVEGEIA